MKKILLPILIVAVIVIINLQCPYCENPNNYDGIVTVDTNSVVIVPKLPGRRTYCIMINTGTLNAVWISTKPITADNYQSLGAIPIPNNFGYYEDNFQVYQSTWYGCTANGESYISYSQRD